jgi:hypothetical protein
MIASPELAGDSGLAPGVGVLAQPAAQTPNKSFRTLVRMVSSSTDAAILLTSRVAELNQMKRPSADRAAGNAARSRDSGAACGRRAKRRDGMQNEAP